MREVVKWNKDHLTGDLVEKKCFKPNNGLKGTAKIEIFGEDGKLKNETYTENIIPNIIDKSEFYRGMFRTIINGGGSFNDGYNQPSSFRNIVLGTNARNEDKDNVLGDVGTIVGWCPKTNTNAGSSTTRGVYNPNESYSEWKDGYYHQHLVYDFGTSQANGTFNSIWWSKGVYGSTDDGGSIMPLYCLSWLRPIGGGRGRVELYDNPVVTCVNDTYYKYDPSDSIYKRLLNGDLYLNGATSTPIYSKDEKYHISYWEELPSVMTQIPNSDGQYVKIDNLNRVYGTKNNYKCDFDLCIYDKNDNKTDSVHIDLRELSGITTYMNRGDDVTRQLRVKRIFKVTENGDIYMAIYGYFGSTGSSRYRIFPTYDNTNDKVLDSAESERDYYGHCLGVYNIFEKRWTVEPNFGTLESARFRSCNWLGECLGYVKLGNEIFYYRNSANNPIIHVKPHETRNYCFVGTSLFLRDCQSKYFSTSGQYGRVNCHIHGTDYIVTGTSADTNNDSYYGGDFRIIHGYSAHTKLPNPVVKTSADTMKIQYDIYVQVPKIASNNGDYITFND